MKSNKSLIAVEIIWQIADQAKGCKMNKEELNKPLLLALIKQMDTQVIFGETPLHYADHKLFRDVGLFAFTLTNIQFDDLYRYAICNSPKKMD